MRTPLARSLVDLPPETWDYLEAVITYFVPLPVLFFLEPFLGKARAIRLLWRLQLGFAIVATVTDIATGTPYAAQVPYNFTIITWLLVALYLMFWRVENATKQLKIVRAGLTVFVLLAGHATLSGILPLPLKTSAEPLGLYSAQSERIEHPSTVLSELNRILCGKIRGQFVTGACLFFDADGSKVSYASAGHPPLVLVKSSGEAPERKLESVLMGFFAQAEYQEMDVELEKGDKLVLYTDGLTEAMNTRGDFFGVERLLAFFEEHASDSAEALAAEILDHVQSWSGKPFDDDVTLLIVGVT